MGTGPKVEPAVEKANPTKPSQGLQFSKAPGLFQSPQQDWLQLSLSKSPILPGITAFTYGKLPNAARKL